MSSPRVSIIIPVYNGANYLRDAIDSALAQSWPSFEVVVVNDGSNDGGATESIAKSYGERIRYFAKPNGHVASALNFGVRVMSGDYFSWLSHDDLYHPDKLAEQMKVLLAEGPRTAAYSDFETLEVATGERTIVRMKAPAPEHFRYFITLNSSVHGCTLLVPKGCLEEAGPFREDLRTTQDYDMWFRVAARCRFVHVPKVLVISRHHAEQGTRALRDVALEECDRLAEGFLRELSQEEVSAGAHATPATAYASMASTFSSRGFARACAAAELKSLQALKQASPAGRLRDRVHISLRRRAGQAFRMARKVRSKLRTGD